MMTRPRVIFQSIMQHPETANRYGKMMPTENRRKTYHAYRAMKLQTQTPSTQKKHAKPKAHHALAPQSLTEFDGSDG